MKKAMIEQLVLGMVGTNTWLIKNKESNELLIIDPADESARIEEKIDRMGGIPVISDWLLDALHNGGQE